MSRPRIVLASGSAIRAEILQNAGVDFDIARPDVDEDIIKREAADAGHSLEETAQLLADAKALAITDRTGALIIGGDQVLEFKGNPFDKPKDLEEAEQRLCAMAGKSHSLINAVAVARNGEIIWRNIDSPTLKMRSLTEAEIKAYIRASGEQILASVGAYQVEKLGSRLFEKIEGDFYAVLGLSLYPLLTMLRREGALDF